MTLVSANGNFPYLVSVFNAQSLITPADYVAGTTLDKKPNGTGALKLVGQLRHRLGRQVRPERRVVGPQDPARRHGVHLLR